MNPSSVITTLCALHLIAVLGGLALVKKILEAGDTVPGNWILGVLVLAGVVVTLAGITIAAGARYANRISGGVRLLSVIPALLTIGMLVALRSFL